MQYKYANRNEHVGDTMCEGQQAHETICKAGTKTIVTRKKRKQNAKKRNYMGKQECTIRLIINAKKKADTMCYLTYPASMLSMGR